MYPEKKITLIEHLDELRGRILGCLACILLCGIGSYIYSDSILDILTHPSRNVITEFYFFAPQAAFLVKIKLSFFSGIILTVPIIFYHTWMFITPGLIGKERRIVFPLSLIAAGLFFAGILFCYYIVLPIALEFLLGFGGEKLAPMMSIDTYIQFVTTLLAIFGVLFLLPIIVYLLSKLNILSTKTLASKRGYILIIIFIVAAIVTPPDIITQIAFALPMWILFEISVFIVSILDKK
ncbi:twin-arginine translocase subunit TatC [Candidatus Omnitrophota bacterium]